ncbi:GFA family protein [Propylenella binzhouense]|uniref:GFA family protein n=1 Tax=Propylenella binzhouense TaxID=2555902 RepID=A0A964T777_9HYPH|nr:GFA family protein [Propylenella binzhouense]MYZ49793.1 GFA family protein [Propylenella binzhouense]
MADPAIHTGGCHCGAVRLEAETALERVNTCNCSRCSKKGFIWTFVPKERLTLLSGEGQLQEYRSNTGKLQHLTCRIGGVQPFARGTGPGGTDVAAVNVRRLDGIDLARLRPLAFDSKSL